MKQILILISLFYIASSAAQPTQRSINREPVRGEMIAHPTEQAAIDVNKGASKYLTPLSSWVKETDQFTTLFTFPFAWANRQIILHIESASTDYEVLVNGQSAGYNTNPHNPTDFNITKLSNEGKNTLSIRYAAPSSLAKLESWHENPTPKLGHTYLLCQPTMRIREVVVKTWNVDGEMKAEVGIIMRSSALNPRTSRFYYDLRTPSNETVAHGQKDFSLDMRREDTLRFVTTIPELLKWSQEMPTQYTLRLKTQYEGRYAEYMQLKLGFRTVEMDGGKMSINGRPVTLRAKEVATTTTPNQIALLREQGYNTLKFRAGALSDELLDQCDMMGMYVVVQSPIDTRRNGNDIRRGGNPTNDPAWLEAYLERTTDTYHATKRHPSVVAFSMAEKSANGFNLYESYLNMKAMDEPRPFIYRDAEGQWNTDALEIEIE